MVKGAREGLWTWWDAAVAICVVAGVTANSIAGLATPRVSVLATTFGLLSGVVLATRTRYPLVMLFVVSASAVVPTLVAGTFPDFYAREQGSRPSVSPRPL